ncbi:MAG: polyprenyl diphosphate synthase [Candidatus Yanofskybacteria bacterium]|nr:polyprenyl diphosphate synthase [Candidatus Yanofskybacteria bacterium]
MDEEPYIPKHIALIPDGNRRWAKAQGVDILEGHEAGARVFLDFMQWCAKRGVGVVSVFGFSTENWKRSDREVSHLLSLFEKGLIEQLAKYNERQEKEKKVCVRVIGEKERFPESLRSAIQKIEAETQGNAGLVVNLALSYGGRWDITRAVRGILGEGYAPETVTQEVFASFLSTAGLPDVDLLIRTSGEQRVSNFLLWQMAYAELFFVEKHWPAFTEQDLDEILKSYSARQRRFGQ